MKLQTNLDAFQNTKHLKTAAMFEFANKKSGIKLQKLSVSEQVESHFR